MFISRPCFASWLSVAVFRLSFHGARAVTILTPVDGSEWDRFGTSVAISGDALVVGAPYHDANGVDGSGSAYVYVRSGSIWFQVDKLTASDGAVSDQFGHSVAIDGDTIVVGAPYHDSFDITSNGSAYVFTRSGGTWSEQAKLTPSAGFEWLWFGWSVAISTDTIVVGGPEDHPGDGRAYVFTRSGITWLEQAMLQGSVLNRFGFSVAISGETLVVGAPYANSGDGTAYVYARTGTSWTEPYGISEGSNNEIKFGWSVGISGETIATGSLDNSADSSVYIFKQSGTNWLEEARVTGAGDVSDYLYGISVDIQGDMLAVGSKWDDDSAGRVYLYRRSGTTWNFLAKVKDDDGAPGDNFGISVAISGDTVVAGAPYDSTTSGVKTGTALVFDLDVFPTMSPSMLPSSQPTMARPTTLPTAVPTSPPTAGPTSPPTAVPTSPPTPITGPTPTSQPSSPPSAAPSLNPVNQPTAEPLHLQPISPIKTPRPVTGPAPKPVSAPTPNPTEDEDVCFLRIFGVCTCFSERTEVQVLGAGTTLMKDLKIGDKVLTDDGYSTVFSFGHKLISSKTSYLQVLTENMETKHPLEISQEQLIYKSDEDSRVPKVVPASDLKVGDHLVDETGLPTKIISINVVVCEGAYSPLTTKGKILINGVLVSTYVTRDWIKDSISSDTLHAFQHGSIVPYRFFCLMFGCENELYNEETGFSPWVHFWYGVEQWQLHLSETGRITFFLVLAIPVIMTTLLGKILLIQKQMVMVYVAAALLGCVVWNKTKMNGNKSSSNTNPKPSPS